MRKITLTYNDIVELNHFLEEKTLSYKVHMHDRCGGQSFTIRAIDENTSNPNESDDVKKEIVKYFENKGYYPCFSESNQEFTMEAI